MWNVPYRFINTCTVTAGFWIISDKCKNNKITGCKNYLPSDTSLFI